MEEGGDCNSDDGFTADAMFEVFVEVAGEEMGFADDMAAAKIIFVVSAFLADTTVDKDGFVILDDEGVAEEEEVVTRRGLVVVVSGGEGSGCVQGGTLAFDGHPKICSSRVPELFGRGNDV